MHGINETKKMTMFANYILDGRTPVEEPNLLRWGRWFENSSRRVKLKQIGVPKNRGKKAKKIHFVAVSTVFLGLDHGYGGKPLLFETMIFNGELDEEQYRCSTWEEAEEMHEMACERVRLFG